MATVEYQDAVLMGCTTASFSSKLTCQHGNQKPQTTLPLLNIKGIVLQLDLPSFCFSMHDPHDRTSRFHYQAMLQDRGVLFRFSSQGIHGSPSYDRKRGLFIFKTVSFLHFFLLVAVTQTAQFVFFQLFQTIMGPLPFKRGRVFVRASNPIPECEILSVIVIEV